MDKLLAKEGPSSDFVRRHLEPYVGPIDVVEDDPGEGKDELGPGLRKKADEIDRERQAIDRQLDALSAEQQSDELRLAEAFTGTIFSNVLPKLWAWEAQIDRSIQRSYDRINMLVGLSPRGDGAEVIDFDVVTKQ